MSGIVGLLAAVPGGDAEAGAARMLAAISHRGPDGAAIRAEGRAALGLGLFATAPEDVLPPTIARRGDLGIVADIRLDNCAALTSELGLPAGQPDAKIVLEAYLRWGEDCPGHLLGDFAFAILDGERRLFLARDHMGVKPLYYRCDEAGLAFASEPKALFDIGPPFTPIRRSDLNEARVADYLAGTVRNAEYTLFEGILRLPPAHTLTVAAGGRPEIRRYWLPAPAAGIAADPVSEFAALFTDAVRSRLRSRTPAAALLSGGLDSSAIAAVAAKLRRAERGPLLRTFSMVFDETPDANERPQIEAVLAAGEFEPTFVAADSHAPFAEHARTTAEQDGVHAAPGLSATSRVYRRAAAEGVRVLLDGHGGDEVLSHGRDRIDQFAGDRRWWQVLRAAMNARHIYGESPLRALTTFARSYGPFRRGGALHRAGRKLRELAMITPPARLRPSSVAAYIDPAFLRRMASEARAEPSAAATAVSKPSPVVNSHLQTLRAPYHAYNFEVLDLATAAAGVEARYPFFDKRLVEFCLALPPEEKLKDGWTRLVLRRAMDGLLPRSVQWRRDKFDFKRHLIAGMIEHHAALIDDVLADEPHLGRFANLPALRGAFARLKLRPKRANGIDAFAVWSAVGLGLWLRQIDAAPERTDA